MAAPCRRTPRSTTTSAAPSADRSSGTSSSRSSPTRPSATTPPASSRAGIRRRSTWRSRPGRAAPPSGSSRSPGHRPRLATVLMGAGDSHGCADIGLVEGVNCRFIEGQGLDIGRPLNSSFPLGTRDPSHVDRFTPGLGGDGTNSPSNLDGVPDLQWRANINPTEEQGRAVQPARRLQRHAKRSHRVQHVPRAAEQRLVQRHRRAR